MNRLLVETRRLVISCSGANIFSSGDGESDYSLGAYANMRGKLDEILIAWISELNSSCLCDDILVIVYDPTEQEIATIREVCERHDFTEIFTK